VAHPATVAPLHRFAQFGRNAFHETPQRANDLLILDALIFEIRVEARVRFHPRHCSHPKIRTEISVVASARCAPCVRFPRSRKGGTRGPAARGTSRSCRSSPSR